MTRRADDLPGVHCLGLLLAGLAGITSQARALNCTTPAPALIAGIERSQWREFDTQGNTLVHEAGTLNRIGLDVGARCTDVDWSAQWTHSTGARAYDGVTNTQVPVQTTSHVDSDALSLAGMFLLNERWALGGRLSYHQINRGIDSTGTVLGFPERYTYGLAALGARFQTALGEHLRLALTGWIGGNTGGNVWVQLPHADAATLPLGRTSLLESSLQLGSVPATNAGWSWQVRLNYRLEATAAGAARALRRNGVLVGAAAQPEIQQRIFGVDAAVQYRF